MLVAHRAARNGQRHFRFVPASPAFAPRPRCARQRAVGRGERSNRFFRKTGSEPHLRWTNSNHPQIFSKKTTSPSPHLTSRRITLRVAASSSAWQLSSVGVVHNIADIWRKIKRRNLSDSFIIQKPQSRSFCQCMPRNFEETFSGFVMSPNSSHKCPKKSDSPFFECRFADQEVCDFAHPCRL